MRPLLTLLFIIVLMIQSISGQLAYSESQFQAFNGKGKAVTLADIVTAAGDADVIFFGEMHDDAVGHAIQAEAFRRIFAEYGSKRSVVLSLEMFERDVQTVVNEYLASLISEQHFMLSLIHI